MIIPFFIPHAGCPHQCVFCDQKRITGREQPPDPGSLAATIRTYLAHDKRGGPAEVAFFGGTFTALERELQTAYLDAIAPFISEGAVECIRISTRPDAITPEILALLRERGVRTVELGVQSFDDDVLRRSGRGHTAADTTAATALLRDHGFAVGFQLMPGLPGDGIDRFRETVSRSVELKPDCVRIYPALVIRDTVLEQLFRAGRYAPLSLEEAVAWCKEAIISFRRAGIPVIRVGLQATEKLGSAGTVVGGPYHPAFRQKVDSALLLHAMEQASGAMNNQKAAVFRVHPQDLSTAIGGRRCNVLALKQRYGFEQVKILPDPRIERGTVRPG